MSDRSETWDSGLLQVRSAHLGNGCTIGHASLTRDALGQWFACLVLWLPEGFMSNDYEGAANASANGYVTAFPAGGTDSGLRVLSYEPQHIERNFVAEPLSSSGQITLVNHGSAPVDLMAAVQ